MIIVLVKYHCKPGQRENFLNEIRSRKIDVTSQHEEGCVQYAYSYDIEDPDLLCLTELWESKEAIGKHSQAEHFKVLGTLKAQYVDTTDIRRFEDPQVG